jgi:hypothetical protein
MPNKHWMERNLARLGFVMFAVGMVILLVGLVGVVLEELTGGTAYASGSEGQLFLRYVFSIARTLYSVGSTFSWIGALFFCLGRFLEVGLVTIVGFERTPPSELIVKGPDENNVVWIGKPYSNSFDAELAAKAFGERLGKSV